MKTRKLVPYVSIAALVAGALGINVGLHAADSFTPNNQPTGWLTPPALSTGWLKQDASLNPDGGGFAYVPWFENSAWQGDLVEWTVLENGDRSTSVENTTPPTNTTPPINWSAREQFAATITTTPDWWTSARKMITWNGSAQKAFLWSNLTVDQKTALDSATYTADSSATSSPILNYVRGDTSQATENGGLYPNRWSLLRDIQHSNPVHVGPPRGRYTFDAYSTFKSDHASRAGRVYVGANDGALHAFNADTGDEVYAYVPSMVFGNLAELTVVPYAHTYFVDGPLATSDAQIGSSNTWATVLVGGLGAGGKGVFVLDVTDPDLDAEGSSDADDTKILYELDSTHTTVGADLGYTYSKAVISKLPDGDWYAVMGNGYNSANGIAKLILINLNTWEVSTISTGSGSSGSPNGLSTPALVDSSTSGSDFMADYAYAGDIDGNVWKFDLNTKTLSYKLFSAGSTKPITTAPDLVSYRGSYLVYFGTGRILTAGDLTNTDTQSIFAVLDSGATVTEASLQAQTLTETTYTGTTPSRTVRYATNTAVDWATKKGWMVNLPLAGERLVTDLQVRAERVQFVTTDPSNADGGDDPAAWLVELNYQTGGSPDSVVIDLNGDSYLTTADNVNGADSDPDDVVDRVVAVQLDDGVSSQPVFAIVDEVGGGTIDTLFVNSMVLPVVEECTSGCVDGFITGSIDVMTDSPYGPTVGGSSDDVTPVVDGLGGYPDGHLHVYDKVHGEVFVDLLGDSSLNNSTSGLSRAGKLEPRRNLTSLNARAAVATATQHLNSIEEVSRTSGSTDTIDGGTEFFVVVSNADLNTGGMLRIGDKSWNVLTYQNMITPKLIALAGAAATTSNLKDDEGQSLVFTLHDILAADGTIRVSFTSQDIRSGLIIPTRPQCVSGNTDWDLVAASSSALNKHITPVGSGASHDGSADVGYRWRNGALTIQLIKASGYALQPQNNGLSGSNKQYLLPHSRSGSTYTLVGGIHAKEFTVNGSGTMSFAEGANESGLLYEAAIFWHYGDYALYDVGGFASCYGASNWQASRHKELDGVNEAKYVEALDGVTSTEVDRYTTALDAVDSCRASSSCTEADLTAKITELHNAILDVADWERLRSYVPNSIATRGSTSRILDIDLELETAIVTPPVVATEEPPVSIDNNLSNRWKTDGPNFVRGRRTWTELIRNQ